MNSCIRAISKEQKDRRSINAIFLSLSNIWLERWKLSTLQYMPCAIFVELMFETTPVHLVPQYENVRKSQYRTKKE